MGNEFCGMFFECFRLKPVEFIFIVCISYRKYIQISEQDNAFSLKTDFTRIAITIIL